MDEPTFWSNAIEHLAWPAVVLYLLHTQKRAVKELIGRVTKVKAGPAEIEAATEQAKETKEQAVGLAGKPVDPPKPEVVRGILENAQHQTPMETKPEMDWLAWYRNVRPGVPLRPRVAIIQDWLRVEDVLRKLGEVHRLFFWNDASPTIVLDALVNQAVLSEATAKIIIELIEIRDRVSQMEFEPPKAISLDFSVACEKVLMRMQDEERAWQAEADRIATVGFGLNS